MSSLSASETTAAAGAPAPAAFGADSGLETVGHSAIRDMAAARAAADEVPPGVDPDYHYAIRVKDIHVDYRTIIDPGGNTLRHTFTKIGKGGRKVRHVNAVRGVSFDVPHGTVLGIIGANGAGKSTTMRAIAGILPPSKGEIVVNGRISTLLALGVGFNGQLTGRQNVVLGSLAAGLNKKQVEERFQQITAWSELEEAIDMPMKAYSSGMYGRLAFAVSTHLEPDVLLIDEALSTGDAHFRRKSYDKMQELVAQAKTIIIVSHGIAAIREMCDECIWMHKGEIVRRGDTDAVTAEYLEFQGVPVRNDKDDEADDDMADLDDALSADGGF